MSEDTRTASKQSVQTECKTLYLSLLCFLRITGNAGHHEGHLRHDGKMHIPRPQRGDAPSARRSILSGKQAVGRFYCFMYEASENLHISPFVCLQQKMDKNKDGVVTIDEFIDCCQNVRPIPRTSARTAAGTVSAPLIVLSLLFCILRMKTSCDRCTSLKTFFNFRLAVEDLEETIIFSLAQLLTWTHTVYSVLCRLFDHRYSYSSLQRASVVSRRYRRGHSGAGCRFLLNKFGKLLSEIVKMD